MDCPSLLSWYSLQNILGVIHRLAPLSLSSAAAFPPARSNVGWSLLRICWQGLQMFIAGDLGPLLSLHPRLHQWDWISGSPVLHRCVHRASRCKFVSTDDAILCSADCDAAVSSELTDRHSIYSLFCLLLFV